MNDRRAAGPNPLYVVATWVPRRTTIAVGSLGDVTFARHLRSDKPLRWHADRLFARFPGRLSWLVDGELTECELADALAVGSGAERRPGRFGASDCGCAGHLLRLARRPATRDIRAAAAVTVGVSGIGVARYSHHRGSAAAWARGLGHGSTVSF